MRRQAPVNIADGFLRIPHLCQKNYLHFRFDIPSETQSNYMRGFSLTRLVIQFNFNVRRPNIDLMNLMFKIKLTSGVKETSKLSRKKEYHLNSVDDVLHTIVVKCFQQKTSLSFTAFAPRVSTAAASSNTLNEI